MGCHLVSEAVDTEKRRAQGFNRGRFSLSCRSCPGLGTCDLWTILSGPELFTLGSDKEHATCDAPDLLSRQLTRPAPIFEQQFERVLVLHSAASKFVWGALWSVMLSCKCIHKNAYPVVTRAMCNLSLCLFYSTAKQLVKILSLWLFHLRLKMPQIYQQLHQIVVRDSSRCCSLTLRFFTADVDDLNICYVLRNEENATSDLFHFSVQDNGKAFTLLLSFPFFRLRASSAKRSWAHCQMALQQNVKRYKLARVKIKPATLSVRNCLGNL